MACRPHPRVRGWRPFGGTPGAERGRTSSHAGGVPYPLPALRRAPGPSSHLLHPCPYSPLCPPAAALQAPSRCRLMPHFALRDSCRHAMLPKTSLPPPEGAAAAAPCLRRAGDAAVAGHAGQAVPKQPRAGRARARCTLRPLHSPQTSHPCRPPRRRGGPGWGRCCRAASPSAPAFAGLEDGGVLGFFFATRRGNRIDPRAYFIGLMNFASQRLPSLPHARRTARAELRPTPQSSFISCQQENKR